MRELLDILAAAEEIFQRGETATLATVVHVEGSSYRLPGARMLVDSAGRRVGSVSGGCLEADVARRGRLLTCENPNALVRYDGTDEDVAWGFGLGCQGSILVFIEHLDRMPESLKFIRRCFDHRAAGCMCTVFDVAGDFPLGIGHRLMMTANSIEGNDLTLLTDAAKCLTTGGSATVTYENSHGRARVFVEAIHPPLPLVVFGAGHDAVPLVYAAKSLGWHVTVWDRRAGYARADRFAQADAVLSGDPEEIPIASDTAAILMTHHFPDDRALLPMLLKSSARYVGVLGPRSRTDRILACLAPPLPLDRLYAPIGLDLGAQSPEQVALAIVAEILAVYSQRPGVPLRLRSGAIHPTSVSRTVRLEAGLNPEPARS